MSMKDDPRAFAVVLGFEALRLATGQPLKKFTAWQIIELLTRAARNQYGDKE